MFFPRISSPFSFFFPCFFPFLELVPFLFHLFQAKNTTYVFCRGPFLPAKSVEPPAPPTRKFATSASGPEELLEGLRSVKKYESARQAERRNFESDLSLFFWVCVCLFFIHAHICIYVYMYIYVHIYIYIFKKGFFGSLSLSLSPLYVFFSRCCFVKRALARGLRLDSGLQLVGFSGSSSRFTFPRMSGPSSEMHQVPCLP